MSVCKMKRLQVPYLLFSNSYRLILMQIYVFFLYAFEKYSTILLVKNMTQLILKKEPFVKARHELSYKYVLPSKKVVRNTAIIVNIDFE